MNNRNRMVAAAIVGLVVIGVVAWIAGFYAIPFAIVGVFAALMLFGGHLGIYALPPATAALMKKALWLVAIAIAIVWGISSWNVASKKKESKEQAKPAPTATAERTYAASYDFSQVKAKAASKTFTVPKGDGWVLVTLPVYYRATFSSATANAGELDKLNGSKPIPFGEQTKFGTLPSAVAIRVPEGCEMTVSLAYAPELAGKQPAKEKQVSFFGDKPRGKQKQQKPARKVLPDPDIPTGPQYL